MRDPRSQVAGRVDRVPGGRPQAQPDPPHEGPAERRDEELLVADLLHDRRPDEHQHERRDRLAEHVRRRLADRRRGAEDRQLRRGVGRLRPVRQVVQPDEHRAGERPEELAADQRPDPLGRHRAEHRTGQDAGRVDVPRRPRRAGRVDAGHHRERPPGGDHQPAGVLGLRLAQQHAGDDPVAEQDEHHRAQELALEFGHAGGLREGRPNGSRATRRFYNRGPLGARRFYGESWLGWVGRAFLPAS